MIVAIIFIKYRDGRAPSQDEGGADRERKEKKRRNQDDIPHGSCRSSDAPRALCRAWIQELRARTWFLHVPEIGKGTLLGKLKLRSLPRQWLRLWDWAVCWYRPRRRVSTLISTDLCIWASVNFRCEELLGVRTLALMAMVAANPALPLIGWAS